MITLTGIGWDHERAMGPLLATAPIYEREFGVRVEWAARSLKDFGDAPIKDLARRYDLIILDHPHIGIAQTADNPLLPIDAHLDEHTLAVLARESVGPSHASYTLAQNQWALAIDGAMQAGVCRPDLFTGDMPRTWDDAMTLARDLAKRDAKLAIPLAACDAVCSFISIAAGLGGMNAPSERLVTREVGLRALDTLHRLAAAAHPRSFDWNPIQMLDHMSTHDDVALCPLTFCYTNYSRAGFREHRLAFGTIPQARGSILGGAGFAVSARCAHPREAAEYGAWLCSGEIQRTAYTEHGGQPGNRAAWTDPRADEMVGGFFSATLDVIEHAFIRPRHHGWPAFQEWAGNEIRRTLIEGADPGACLEALESRYAQSLELSAGASA